MGISEELKALVYEAVKCFGEALREKEGEAIYQLIEETRLSFKETRHQNFEFVREKLNLSYQNLKGRNKVELYALGKSFALMLELINSCEAAYRAHLLKTRLGSIEATDQKLIFVFTSHPTEARSKNFLSIMGKVNSLLECALIEGFDAIRLELAYYLRIALAGEIAKHKSPTVKDEAMQIYHLVLNPDVLGEQVKLHQNGVEVGFRTWSGGDKDGHPGVGPKEMKESLQLSRIALVDYLVTQMKVVAQDMVMTENPLYHREIEKLNKDLLALRKLAPGDGAKVVRFRKNCLSFKRKLKSAGLMGKEVLNIESLMWLYPALVMPLELREDSELIHQSLKKPKNNICQMLLWIKKLSKGHDPKWYARGLIVSMCQAPEDLKAGLDLVTKYLGKNQIPTVPLFENAQGLERSIEILTYVFKGGALIRAHQQKWHGKFEVMLGYSDSSKENGVLSGRLMLESAIHQLDTFLNGQGLQPVFFHGSGGSISRGGGSTKEQIAWWPKSSLSIFKMTVQGESIQRHFSHPLIVRSQVKKIVDEFKHFTPREGRPSKAVHAMAENVQVAYRKLTSEPAFHHLVSHTTPYSFLNHLKLGSRPSNRNKSGEFSLRAIPWILCWTQTRLLLPMWWGVGEAWKKTTPEDRLMIIRDFKSSALLASFVKHLGFTFEKMEFGVWLFLLERSGLSAEEKNYWRERFVEEMTLAQEFFFAVTGEREFTWFRRWLKESIVFRSSMIHPLNVLQKIALEKQDADLLRLTVTGISSGMLTTG